MIPGGRTVECSVRKASIQSNLNQNKSDGNDGALETIAAALHRKSSTVSNTNGPSLRCVDDSTPCTHVPVSSSWHFTFDLHLV